MSPSRLAFALLLASVGSVGCNETSMSVRVVAPDGGDPFLPPDAATEARFRIDNDTVAPVTVPVAPNGFFTLDVTVDRTPVPSRGIVEALRGGAVVGGGATPPMDWISLGSAIVKVFVQRRDTVVEYPWRLRHARSAPTLFEVAPNFVVALGGGATSLPIESFNELSLLGASDGAMWDSTFGADASFVRLGNGHVLAVRGCAALVWNPTTNAAPTMPQAMPPQERCDVTRSTVVQEPGGGALLLGGRRGNGEVVARADVVMPDGTWMSALPMAAPRERPSAVRTGTFEALVGGGQVMGAPFLERYARTLDAAQRPLRTGMARVDNRRAATLVDATDGVVLALGGAVLGSSDLTAEDVVIDTRCFSGGCPVLVGTPALLRERRRDAVAALAEGGRVVVASGAGAGGLAASVEVIDASRPRAPVAQGPVASLPYDGLSALSLSTGAVVLVGGGGQTVWHYRH